MAAEGTAIDPGEVIVTTGGQQVIDLVCKTLIDPGDVIVAEAPTYPGAVPSFSAYQADVEQIEMDADGMPIDALEETLDRLAAQGRRPKFIYTIPNFQNPGGVTMSLPRRRRLVEVARERELLVLEDNPYGLLRYEGEPLPTLYSLDAAAAGREGASDLVIYLGTFSKILSPGPAARLGGRAAAGAREAQPLQTGRRPVLLAGHADVRCGVLRRGGRRWLRHVERLCELYRAPPRRDARRARRALRQRRREWTTPEGGLFIWATLDERIDTTDLLALARKEGVAFVPGRAALHGRTQRSLLDAAQLRGRAGGGDPRGHPADRQRDLASSSACSARSPGARRPARPSAPRRGQDAEEGGRGAGEAERAEPLADVVALPRRRNSERARRRQDR